MLTWKSFHFRQNFSVDVIVAGLQTALWTTAPVALDIFRLVLIGPYYIPWLLQSEKKMLLVRVVILSSLSLGRLLNVFFVWTPNENTVCSRSSDPFYIVSYYMKWVTTSCTYGIRNIHQWVSAWETTRFLEELYSPKRGQFGPKRAALLFFPLPRHDLDISVSVVSKGFNGKEDIFGGVFFRYSDNFLLSNLYLFM